MWFACLQILWIGPLEFSLLVNTSIYHVDETTVVVFLEYNMFMCDTHTFDRRVVRQKRLEKNVLLFLFNEKK